MNKLPFTGSSKSTSWVDIARERNDSVHRGICNRSEIPIPEVDRRVLVALRSSPGLNRVRREGARHAAVDFLNGADGITEGLSPESSDSDRLTKVRNLTFLTAKK